MTKYKSTSLTELDPLPLFTCYAEGRKGSGTLPCSQITWITL